MNSWLLILLGNVVLFVWSFRKFQPPRRYEELAAYAREWDTVQREAGFVFEAISLKGRGWLGSVGVIRWQHSSGAIRTGKVEW